MQVIDTVREEQRGQFKFAGRFKIDRRGSLFIPLNDGGELELDVVEVEKIAQWAEECRVQHDSFHGK